VDTAVRVWMSVRVGEAGPRRRRTQVVQAIMATDPQQFFKVRHAAAPPLPSLARAGWRCSFVRTREQVGMGDITRRDTTLSACGLFQSNDRDFQSTENLHVRRRTPSRTSTRSARWGTHLSLIELNCP